MLDLIILQLKIKKIERSDYKGGYEIRAEIGYNNVSFVVSEDQARSLRVEDVLDVGIKSGNIKEVEIVGPVKGKPRSGILSIFKG